MKIINVVGARPNFIKISPILMAMKKHTSIKQLLVHTGQHSEVKMNKWFFDEVDIPEPDFNLGVRHLSNPKQISGVMKRFEDICLTEKPDLILVVGDANPTISCSLVGAYMGIKVAHVEAGLRSFDRTMPEEINRIVTDRMSDFLFITEKSAEENLLREGIPKKNIFFVGNVMIDTLIRCMENIEKSEILRKLKVEKGEYAVLTMHRPSNVDEKRRFISLMKILNKVSKKTPLVYPIHPRAKKNITKFGLDDAFKNIKTIDPLGYLDFIKLLKNAKFVLTDSGGVQEETTYLNVPCLTLRDNTERPVTVEIGTNKIIGSEQKSLLTEISKIISGNLKKKNIPQKWDGKTSKRIVKILMKQAK